MLAPAAADAAAAAPAYRLPCTHTRLCATDANPTNFICTSKLPVAASSARNVSLPLLLLLKVYCTRRRQGNFFSRPSQTGTGLCLGSSGWGGWQHAEHWCISRLHSLLVGSATTPPARPLLLFLDLGAAWQYPRRVISPSIHQPLIGSRPSTDTGPIASHSPSQPSWPAVVTSTDVSTTTTLLFMSPSSLLLLQPTRSKSWPAAVWPRQKTSTAAWEKSGAP